MRPLLTHPVARLRVTQGLTQKELALAVGCSHSTIQSIELGRLKLSKNLERKIDDFLEYGIRQSPRIYTQKPMSESPPVPPPPLPVSESVTLLRTRDGKIYQQTELYEWKLIWKLEDILWMDDEE